MIKRLWMCLLAKWLEFNVKADVFSDVHTLDEVAENTIAVINSNLKSSRVVGFAWEISKSDYVSNSHHQPLSGVSNWGGNTPDAPTGYPGWSGRVWIRYSKPTAGFGSGLFKGTLTHTGTGGFGSYDGPWKLVSSAYHKSTAKHLHSEPQIYSWDYRFFDSDFPGLNMGRAFDLLAGKTADHHHYLWEDPDIEWDDKQLIAEYKQRQLTKEIAI